jgi:hypothetical protein
MFSNGPDVGVGQYVFFLFHDHGEKAVTEQ